jgi:hypothetical protein
MDEGERQRLGEKAMAVRDSYSPLVLRRTLMQALEQVLQEASQD